MQTQARTFEQQELIAAAEKELRDARKNAGNGFYEIVCALAIMVMKRDARWGVGAENH
jgi:uncharacterized protein (UPF0332 family)